MKIKYKLLITMIGILMFSTCVLTLAYKRLNAVNIIMTAKQFDSMGNEVSDRLNAEETEWAITFSETILENVEAELDECMRNASESLVLLAKTIVEDYKLGMDESYIFNRIRAVSEQEVADSGMIGSYYLIMPDGWIYKLTGNGKTYVQNVETEEEYRLGISGNGKPVTSGVKKKNGKYCVTMSEAFYNQAGNPAGVIVSEIYFEVFAKTLANLGDNEFGKVLLIMDSEHVEPKRMFSSDAYASEAWKKIIQMSEQQKIENLIVNLDGKDYYCILRKSEKTNWVLCSFIELQRMQMWASELEKSIKLASADAQNKLVEIEKYTTRFMNIIMLLVCLISIFVILGIANKMVKPIENLLKGVQQIEAGNLDTVIEVSRKDEIGVLTVACNDMATALKSRIEEIKEMTAMEQRNQAEVELAANMQKGMLPQVILEDNWIHAKGFNKAARALGGDFYDYFYLDENHLLFVIADVSDKGIPAALFMTNGRLLIRELSRQGNDAVQIMKQVNNVLSRNNENLQFITAFLCLLNIQTGELQYINAGHEMPFLKRKGQSYEPMKADAGVPLGIMENYEYEKNVMLLGEGDSIFLFTDGVSDCRNEKDELYSVGRVLTTLNGLEGDPIEGMNRQLDDYSGDVEQFDDITMLNIRFKEKRIRKN